MMHRIGFTICCGLISTGLLFGQDSRPAKTQGMSKHLLKVFEDQNTLREEHQSLDDIATNVSSALSKVNRKELSSLQDRLGSLQSQEEELKRMLKEVDFGLPVPLSVTEELDASSPAVSVDSLQSARELLLGLKSDLARRQRLKQRRRDIAKQREDAKRPTLSTRALLQSLAQLPEVDRSIKELGVTTVAASPFPRKLADALYRTGDYRGALRQYRRSEEQDATSLESKDRYRMARCYEWLGDTAKAVEALDNLMKQQPDESDFWNQRAKSYHRYLSKSFKLEKVLKKS